jgi:hypothetical protein
MKYYTYKITFKDLPGYFYYGKHKDDGKPYFGSPVTWAFLWMCFEPEIQILHWYRTDQEAHASEEAIIRATWKDKYSLNENAGGLISEEILSANGRSTGAAYGATNLAKIPKEILVANGKVNGKANAPAMNSHPNTAENRKSTVRVMNSHPNTLESQKCEAMNAHPNTIESQKSNGRKSCSQKWMSTDPNWPPKVTNAGGLTSWQKARGIDTRLRVQVKN